MRNLPGFPSSVLYTGRDQILDTMEAWRRTVLCPDSYYGFVVSETRIGYRGWAGDCFWNISEMVHRRLLSLIRLVSQARPTSAKEGKGLVNCVYKPCPTALYSAVQSHCSILSHDALCHCLSSNRTV